MSDDTQPLSKFIFDGLRTFVDVASERNIAYALIGGVAAGIRSRPRFTRDIDFILEVPQLALPGFLEELEGRGFTFDLMGVIRDWTREHITKLSYHGVRVDWLKPILPVYRHVLDRATTESWAERTLRVASAEGLILTKLIAFRPQDQLDIESILAANRGRLDLDWVRQEWQAIGPLDQPPMPQFEEMVARSYPSPPEPPSPPEGN